MKQHGRNGGAIQTEAPENQLQLSAFITSRVRGDPPALLICNVKINHPIQYFNSFPFLPS